MKTNDPKFREVLIRFLVSQDINTQLLGEYVLRYPQYEAELRAFYVYREAVLQMPH